MGSYTWDKTTQLPAQSWTTSTSSEDEGKNDLVCSSIQRDAENHLYQSQFPLLSPSSRITYSVHLVPLLHGVWVWFVADMMGVLLIFILTVPQEKSTSTFCNHTHFHLVGLEEKQDTIATSFKTVHPKLTSPNGNPGACEPTDIKLLNPTYPQKVACVQVPMLGKASRHSQQLPEIYPTRLQTTIRK